MSAVVKGPAGEISVPVVAHTEGQERLVRDRGKGGDRLAQRSEVDKSRIEIVRWSLGGDYAPRAAAFEKRFALGGRRRSRPRS
ncbi:hypothetical protein AB0L41_23995 [Amycolatopsis mediterranei]|uniref:hypothetical protein n=1 Tax=Amycolatopsis mediterranei TaxID=33910 RepID=UPI003434F88E